MGTMIEFLEGYEIDHWADWMRVSRDRIRRGDLYGVRYLLGAFGGVGSFSDLYLHPVNGHPLSESDVDLANERLSDLRNAIHNAASSIAREVL